MQAAYLHFGPELGRCLAARPDCADACDVFGNPVLYLAASQGLARAVYSLLVAGAFADFPGVEGSTALHAAASRGHDEVVSVTEAREAVGSDRGMEGRKCAEVELLVYVLNYSRPIF
jgi:ankyrin repeat protein